MGSPERTPQSRHGPASPVDREQVKALLRANPDLVLRELRESVERTTRVAVSHTQMWRVVRELDLRLRKVAPCYRARRRRQSQAARRLLIRLRSISPEELIYLDESGVSTQMTRRYARAPRGVRVHETTPEDNWTTRRS